MAREKKAREKKASEKRQLEITEKEEIVVVSRTVLKQKTEKVRKIKIRPFVTATAAVSLKYGLTIPTVEFGSARVDVFISCPCYKEEILDVYGQVRELVDELVSKEADEIEGGK